LLKEARDTSRVIVVEFPSHEMAAKRFALQASNRVLLIFGGELA
jgi:hypothetical protein